MENNLKIVQVKVSELKSAEYNPRKWDEQAIRKLTENTWKN